MCFYKVGYSDTEACVVVLNDYDLYGFKYTDLLIGKAIERWDERICLYYEEEGEWEDYLANPLHWPLLSEHFVSILNRVKARIQYFPANIRNRATGERKTGYYVANITELIFALDLDASDYDLWDAQTGQVHRLNKLVIKKSKVNPTIHIFRLGEYPFSLIVSEELKKMLEFEKISGIDFWQVETS